MSAASVEPGLPRGPVWLGHPLARAGLAIVAIGLAGVVLHRLTGEVRLADLRADLAAARPEAVLRAAIWTLASFVALGCYDLLALRAVAPGKVPAGVAVLTGAAGFALSNCLGFSYVIGPALRYRVYARHGLDLESSAAVLGYAFAAFWSAILTLLGLLFLSRSGALAEILPLPGGVEVGLGLLCLSVVGGGFALLAFGPRRIAGFGLTLPLPRPPLALALSGAGLADLIASAMVLYALLPTDLGMGFPAVFTVYLAAVALGAASHAPGGIGVFEATMLGGLGAAGRSDVIAALVLYRVIYTGVPFLLAVGGVGIAAILRHRRQIEQAGQVARGLAQGAMPVLAAGGALISGAVLIASGSLPAIGSRIGMLRGLVPLPVLEVSHLMGSVAGVLLLVVARGLYRRLHRAYLLALGLLGLGILASLAKGLDVEEAVILAVSASVLIACRSAFRRVDGSAPLKPGLGWLLGVAALFVALSWIGLFAYRHVAYRDALWWQVAWSADAPRFLRATLAAAIALSAVALNAVLGARSRRHLPEPIPQAVRDLVAASPDSDAGLALLGDKSFLMDGAGRAFLAYADTGDALVCRGDPVGAADAAGDLLWQFREMADREGKRAVFYAMSPRHLATFLDMGFTAVKFGEVGRVDLAGFSLDGPGMKDLRQARNRAGREGYRFEIVPAPDFPAICEELRSVSAAWLAKKQGKEKSFALGSFDPAYLAQFDTAVLRAPGGQIVAFANILNGAGVELSVDLMRHAPSGPGFAMDALFAELLLWGQGCGFARFNLGAAPFSGAAGRALASPWQRLGAFLYKHGEPVYPFGGLRGFKEKFRPDWTPHYIVCEGGMGVARAFLAANLLVSGGVAGLMRKGGA